MNRRQFLNFGKPQTKFLQQRNSNLTAQEKASRFLTQATLGATLADINEVAQIGEEAWIEKQFVAPKTQTVTYMLENIEPVYQVEAERLLGAEPFRWAWWQAVMTGSDLLRQRVAMALSEIMVISTRADLLEDWSLAVAAYYDMLLTHAFGNFRDLLLDVTLSPAMGFYLSHAGNRKSDLSVNRFPDENYAREVMQLFSIGLFELNLDGSRKLDATGEPIPTYNNADISEFAKIFTGMTYHSDEPWWMHEDAESEEDWFVFAELNEENGILPMQMVETFHEQGQKRLLNGKVVPAGQTGLQDVQDAVDNLFNHANVGPFIGRLLIQRLIKSNPSSAYIERVASAFNNNGNGVRGDMKAVVQAILLDDEARNTEFITQSGQGMLREPFIRYTQLCRAFQSRNENGENLFYNGGYYAAEMLNQYPFLSPSVFNFFQPDFQPIGLLEQANLVAPEFQIANSVSIIQTANFWEEIVLEGYMMEVPEGLDPEDLEMLDPEFPEQKIPTVSRIDLNLDPYHALEGNIDALIAQLNLLLTYGTLSPQTEAIMRTTLNSIYEEDDDWDVLIRNAILLFMHSPEYNVLK